MESLIQLILVFSIVSLTAIFVVVGIWTVLILKDVKKISKKVSEVGDDVGETVSQIKGKVEEGLDHLNVLRVLFNFLTEKGGLRDMASEGKTRIKKMINDEEEKEKTVGEKPVHHRKSLKRLFFKKKE